MDQTKEASRVVKVVPVKAVTHKNFSDLVGIRGHKNFYVNMLSGKITYKEGKVKIPTGCFTIMEAKREVQTYIEQRKTGKSAGSVKRRLDGVTTPLAKDLFEEMIESKKPEFSPATLRTYYKTWRIAIGPFWGHRTTTEFNHENLMAYKQWYLKNHPERYFDQTYNHLGVLFKYTQKMGYIEKLPDMTVLKNIMEVVQKNSKRVKVGRALSIEETEKVLWAVDKYYEKGRTYGTTPAHKRMLFTRSMLALLLALKSGMRKMEILGLKWEQYDEKKRILKVWSTKNQKWRDVPLLDDHIKFFALQRKYTEGSEFIFPMFTDPERNISGQILDKVWIQVKKVAGIPGRLRFHDLRHTFATRTAEDGWPPVVACEVLDQSLTIYQRTYCKPSFDSKTDWMNRSFESKKAPKRKPKKDPK